MKQLLIFIILISSIAACNNGDRYEPKGLTKLSDSEIVERIVAKTLTFKNTVIKDSVGNAIPKEEAQKIDNDKFYGEYYVNTEDEVVEVVVRKGPERARKRNKMISNALEPTEPLVMIDIDCSNVQTVINVR